MLPTKRLVDLIERNADALSKAWLKDIQGREDMPTYQADDPDVLYDRVYRVYSQLGRWISKQTTKQDIGAHYTVLGAERFREGFRLSEVVQALTLTRRHLWLKILFEGLLDTALDLHGAMELNNSVVLFFDRAILYSVQGYEAERARRDEARGAADW
jgi:hypothetical protein